MRHLLSAALALLLAPLIYVSAGLSAVKFGGRTSSAGSDLPGVENVLQVPAGFGTALLAVPLLFTIVSAARWRGVDDAVAGPAVPSPYDAARTSPSAGGARPTPPAGDGGRPSSG